MKRFIRYLYEYERGRRLRNVGFVKVEQNGNECTLHIHGKGLHMKGERKLTVYLFFKAGDECVGIWQGTIDNVNPAINYRLYYKEEDVGGTENFQKINGIILESEMGHKYAAVWDDATVDIGNMRILNPSQERDIPREKSGQGESESVTREKAGVQSDPERKEKIQERPDPGRKEEQQESSGLDRKEGVKERFAPDRKEESQKRREFIREEAHGENPESGIEGERQESPESAVSVEFLERREPVQEEELRESPGFVREDESDTEQEAAASRENPQRADTISQEACEQDDEQNKVPQSFGQCTKIRRNDIAKLPRCEWKWANNSFLLHGYYNYHHLALIHEGNRFLLGVPGIYHPQEAKAASVFGFTEFIPVQDMEVDLTEDEGGGRDQFGYWCRPVKKPLKM